MDVITIILIAVIIIIAAWELTILYKLLDNKSSMDSLAKNNEKLMMDNALCLAYINRNKEEALANNATLETLLDLQKRIVEIENELPEKNTPKNRAMKFQNEIAKYIYEDEGKCKLMVVKVDGMVDNNDNIVE